jgi:stearoyl-CoA desaturase (delta-9 desaturase)
VTPRRAGPVRADQPDDAVSALVRLWWAAHHRRHHQHTDRLGDPHSPVRDGFAFSHLWWMFSPANQATDLAAVADLAAFGELRLLDRFHHLVPLITAGGLLFAGALVHLRWPALTSGPQLAVWGFSVSTVLLYQATFAVNSLSHLVGRRAFDTRDQSRNNWWLALATLGEGWHNNHHRFPGGARAGFTPWQLDTTWLGLRALERVRLVRNLRPVPPRLLAAARRRSAPWPSSRSPDQLATTLAGPATLLGDAAGTAVEAGAIAAVVAEPSVGNG